MKTNLYIFSNTILSRKDNSLLVSTMPDQEALHDADMYENEQEGVLLPPPNTQAEEITKHIPAESIEAIYTFGEVRFTTQFFRCAHIYGIPVHMFNYYGAYIGSFLPPVAETSGKIQLLQYEAYLQPLRRLTIVRAILEAGVKNILANLSTAHYSSNANVEEQLSAISAMLEQLRFANSVAECLGYEGMIRTAYYDAWGELIKGESDFTKRSKQPPQGLVNSLISFGNALLYAAILTEIHRTRLTPSVGFLHEPGDNKHPLVYDISEIFKPLIVDKVIFRVLNLKMISADDASVTAQGYRLKEPARKKFVEEFEQRLKTIIHHKRLNRRVSYRSLIRMECYNLINFLTDKIKIYEPYRSS